METEQLTPVKTGSRQKLNENENTAHPNLWDTMKAVIKGKVID